MGRNGEQEHRDALGLALKYADVDAEERHFDDALRWLDVAEKLNVTLPTDYAERRERWRREASQQNPERGE